MKPNSLKIILLFSIVILPKQLLSQHSKTNLESIKKVIIEMDSVLFKEAFNKCNLELFKTIISDDIEFYDDRSGLQASKEKEIASFKDKCSKPFSVTRKLISTYVDQLGDYGAVQTGEHQFLVDGTIVEKAKFITVWERKEKQWVVKRAISYEHRPIEE